MGSSGDGNVECERGERVRDQLNAEEGELMKES